MEIHYRKSVREERKKRVAAYCRVSTSRADQEESFEIQKKYYEEFIQSNPDWEYAGIYYDKGITGTNAKKRPGFQKMIKDALDGKVDLILVKSISRFSRNIIDCLQYAEMLHSHGVEIRFEKKRFEKGQYSLGNGHIIGYSTRHDGTIYINDDAWIVRKIFQMFLAGNSYSAIAAAVNAAGGHSVTGRPMTVGTVRGILKNETFVGDKLLQKRPPKNFLTHKPDPSVDYDSFYITDGHPAIIDRDTWNRTQKKLTDRKEEQKNGIYSMPGRSSFLYGKVYCGNCGALYKRRTSGNREHKHMMWVCMERRKGKKGNGCKNRTVDETELLQAISDDLGLPWKGVDNFCKEDFEHRIEKILVYGDHLEFIKKS